MAHGKGVANNVEAGNGNRVGDGDHQMQRKSKNNNVIIWLHFVLRVFAFLASLGATLVMALNKEKKTIVVATIGTTPIQATLTANFQQTPAFVFFVIANGMVSLHNLLMFVVELIGHKFDHKGHRLSVIPILDMLNAVLLSGGTNAALFMGQLGRDGNSHARWNKICDKFDSFCNHGSIAIIASSVGLLLMLTLNTIAIFKHPQQHK